MYRAPDPPSWVVKVSGCECSSRKSCEKSRRCMWTGENAQRVRVSLAVFRELKVICPALDCGRGDSKRDLLKKVRWWRNGLPRWLSDKESACHEGDAASFPGSGRSSGGGHDTPLQYSCLENFMDRKAWWAMVFGVTKSWTRLKQWSLMKKYIPSNEIWTQLQGQ